jgi:hypothetical protein
MTKEQNSHEPPTEEPVSPASRYDTFIARLKNQSVIALVMVFVGGVGFASTFIENIEKLWSHVSPWVISDEASRTLYGRVHEFTDFQRSVTSAKVMVVLDEMVTLSSDNKGEFKLVVPSAEVGKRVLVSIRAVGYAPQDIPGWSLSKPLGKLDIPLSPLVDPGRGFGQADVALLGTQPLVSPPSDPLNFHSFEFNYTFGNRPGLRRWTKVDDRLWIEIYKNNSLSFFPVLHTATIDGCQGSVVAKSPISELDKADRTITFNEDAAVQQFFIPGRDCNPLWLRFRNPPAKLWHWVQEMHNIK